jgi:hypothetical protein
MRFRNPAARGASAFTCGLPQTLKPALLAVQFRLIFHKLVCSFLASKMLEPRRECLFVKSMLTAIFGLRNAAAATPRCESTTTRVWLWRRHQSGTSIDHEGRIIKQGDVAVREALCEAAASFCCGSGNGRHCVRGACGSPSGRVCCAIVAVARKLASILHRMWVSETDFYVRLRCQGHATTAIESGAVTAAGSRRISAGVAASMLGRSKG